jgi:DNA-binding transcriptional LysR family regulator
MNKFAALRTFVAVCEQGSFTAASKKIGTSASTVTKAIGRLEDDLGTRLFNRTTRHLSLTDQGHDLFERARNILSHLEEAENFISLSNQSAKGEVRMIVPYLFGRLTLVPKLHDFFARYPEINLQLHFGDNRGLDIIESGFDLAVHTGELPDSSTIRKQLTRGPMVTAASAAYLARHGVPQKPEDLLDHNCLYGRFGGSWAFKGRGNKRKHIRVSGNLVLYNGDALREAAVQNLGIVHSTWWALKHDIQAQNLVPILEKFQVVGHPISVIFPSGRHTPARVRTVIDFLSEITRV